MQFTFGMFSSVYSWKVLVQNIIKKRLRRLNLYRSPVISNDKLSLLMIVIVSWDKKNLYYKKETYINAFSKLETKIAHGDHVYCLTGRKWGSLQRTFHRYFLLGIKSFVQVVSEQNISLKTRIANGYRVCCLIWTK